MEVKLGAVADTSENRLGLVVRRSAGKRKDPWKFSEPTWPIGKALGWYAEGPRLCEPVWPSGKALGW